MKITDALLGEHGVFYAQFAFIENTLAGADARTIQSLGALLAAGLAPHAQIENEILFPAIEEKIGAGGPTTAMRIEHTEIESRLQELSALKGAHDDIEGALARLPTIEKADHARQLVEDVLHVAREHFSKEENVLFPMAEQMLEERLLVQLGAEWSARRGVVLV